MPSTERAVRETPDYLNSDYGIKSWLLTTDHKRIAIMYLISVTLFFLIGGIFAVLIRLELLTPQGDLMQSDTYNRVFTMYGFRTVVTGTLVSGTVRVGDELAVRPGVFTAKVRGIQVHGRSEAVVAARGVNFQVVSYGVDIDL